MIMRNRYKRLIIEVRRNHMGGGGGGGGGSVLR